MTTSKEPFETRFLRIYPEEYNTREYRCLELIEVYGCSDNTGELIQQPPTVQVKEYQW